MSDALEDQIRRAYADGAVGIDYGWKTKLAKMMKNAPLSPSLLEAVQSLRHLLSEDDFEVLEAVIQGKCDEWTHALFRLPTSYRLDFAVIIYVYTMEHPALYKIINDAMHNPSRRSAGSAGGVSSELDACMPFIKYLDTALELLPPEYIVTGVKVRRGVRWVYPSPDKHDPEKHFKPGSHIMWYSFKQPMAFEKRKKIIFALCGVVENFERKKNVGYIYIYKLRLLRLLLTPARPNLESSTF